MSTKRGLGRGLSELLSESKQALDVAIEERASSDQGQSHLPTDILQPGEYQPRRNIDYESLEELANSIRAQGIIQPIIVRSIGDNRYEIIAGERRWRAAQIAGLDSVPVIIRDIPDESAMVMALIENIQREDLNAIEEATALQRLINEFDMTHDETAQAVGKSRATISNLLRLLSLNDDVKQMLEQGDLEMGHARALLSLQGHGQSEAAKSVAGKGLSVRETEQWVKRLQYPASEKLQKSPDPDVQRLQSKLSETLGAKVIIQHSQKGNGKLTIHYNSLDELDGVLEHILPSDKAGQ
jgi:ParB family chromosome partitioning protein